MLDLGGADAVRKRPERAMGRGVAVAADNRRPRQGETLLRPDDVDDSLAGIELVVIFDAEFARVPGEFLDLEAALGIGDAGPAVGRLDVVVDDGERPLRRAHLAPVQAQALEGLRARHFMDEMAVDVEQSRAARRLYDMVVPNLVIQRPRPGHGGLQRPRAHYGGGGWARLLCRSGRRRKGAVRCA